MKQQIQAIQAEITKNKHSRIIWVTFVAFALAPVFGAVFMILMKDAGINGLPGSFRAKAVLFSFEPNWQSYLNLLSQAVGIGGILIFGFVASWLFGREYSDGTAKDLLALPISRIKILNAKFVYYIGWCLALILSNLLLGLLFGYLIGVGGWSPSIFFSNLKIYLITTLMILTLNTPVAFLALFGKGYLAPLGLVAIMLVLAQILGAVGLGNYFPWSVPGIYSGSGGEDLKLQLNNLSYSVLILTGIIGYLATIFWWKYADQSQ